ERLNLVVLVHEGPLSYSSAHRPPYSYPEPRHRLCHVVLRASLLEHSSRLEGFSEHPPEIHPEPSSDLFGLRERHWRLIPRKGFDSIVQYMAEQHKPGRALGIIWPEVGMRLLGNLAEPLPCPALQPLQRLRTTRSSLA